MSYNNNNTPGRCFIKHHVTYGNIYININKYNKYYIKSKYNDIINSYNIPTGYDASKLKLDDVISIIESNNITVKNDTPQGWDNLKKKKKHLTTTTTTTTTTTRIIIIIIMIMKTKGKYLVELEMKIYF